MCLVPRFDLRIAYQAQLLRCQHREFVGGDFAGVQSVQGLGDGEVSCGDGLRHQQGVVEGFALFGGDQGELIDQQGLLLSGAERGDLVELQSGDLGGQQTPQLRAAQLRHQLGSDGGDLHARERLQLQGVK